MTRLSEALKRAAAESGAGQTAEPVRSAEPGTAWQFAPVETMHVPDEPARSADLSAGASAKVEAANRSGGEGGPRPTGAPQVTALPRTERVRLGDTDIGKMVVGDPVDHALVEQYRQLAAVLHHAQKASGARSVMVTSALPSEGKTLTATNLALTLSQSYQRRVLLIDADLRRPRMREMFALPDGDGLTDSLTVRQEPRLPVHQITPTLWVLTSGRPVPDPMSLLVSPSMKQLIDTARDTFDWVVVDTPPIAILPDANLLSAMIDTALLVVSAQSTPYPMVQRAAAAIGTTRILGVVLNRAAKTALPGSYGYYGYQPYRAGHPLPAPTKKRWFGWLRRSRAAHVQ
jgi:capsular exopolysaccharide synthesis family protein